MYTSLWQLLSPPFSLSFFSQTLVSPAPLELGDDLPDLSCSPSPATPLALDPAPLRALPDSHLDQDALPDSHLDQDGAVQRTGRGELPAGNEVSPDESSEGKIPFVELCHVSPFRSKSTVHLASTEYKISERKSKTK